jgi:hypothetical protein
MKRKMKLVLAMLAIVSPVFFACAQDDGPPPGGPGGQDGEGGGRHHRPPPLPLVTALDANHDGVIDANEIANASAALKTLDKNGDGQLTEDEYLPPRPAGDTGAPPRHHPRPAIIAALDANHDGVIDAGEIANAPAALKTLDKNGDGQLTRDEYIGRPPHRPAGGQAPGDGPPPGAPPQDQ